jgi:hypothetical protein
MDALARVARLARTPPLQPALIALISLVSLISLIALIALTSLIALISSHPIASPPVHGRHAFMFFSAFVLADFLLFLLTGLPLLLAECQPACSCSAGT